MRKTLLAMALIAAMGNVAHAQDRKWAAPEVAETAFVGTYATACGARAADWGDWAVQVAAADVQAGQPMVGSGMFAYAEGTYFNASLGEVSMAGSAGVRLHDRYGQAACVAIMDAEELTELDRRRARSPNFPPHRLLSPTGETASITPELLDAAFLAETVYVARACHMRPAAWEKDASDAIDTAIISEADKASGKPTGMAETMQYGAGAKEMASLLGDREIYRDRSRACLWAKTAPEVKRIDGMVSDARKLLARIKAGDWSGAGGIK